MAAARPLPTQLGAVCHNCKHFRPQLKTRKGVGACALRKERVSWYGTCPDYAKRSEVAPASAGATVPIPGTLL